jgi:pyrroloquinoline quinone biosynthesis protein B
MRLAARWSASLVLALSPPGCVAPASESAASTAPTAPFVVVLGTAQDGGLPQIGCRDELCEAARANPARARFQSSILLVDPRSRARWLFDAGPHLPEQLELARAWSDESASPPLGRPPLFDAIFLTHAHFGHYTGLAWLGREVYAANGQRVIGSPRMTRFLAGTPPYDLYVQAGHLALETLEPGVSLPLADGLAVEALPVPHRDEYTDTLAFLVRGPRRALLYLPDIDKWERWDRRIEDLIGAVDFALLDGTFFADGEVPGRSMEDVPHPFVVESIARFAALPASERAKIHFVHLNHTNPATDPSSAEAAAIRAAGMAVAREGERFEL